MDYKKPKGNFWNQEIDKPSSKNKDENKKYQPEEITRRDFIKKAGLKVAKISAAVSTGGWALKEIYKMDKRAEEIEKRRKERKKRQEEIAKQAWQDEDWVKTMKNFGESDSKLEEDEKDVRPEEKREEQIKKIRKDIAYLKKREKSEAEKLADIYLKAFHQLKNKKEFFPPKIFTRYLFIAQQLQESKYKQDAKSSKEAVGVMQNRAISLQDVSRYVYILKRKGEINFTVPKELPKKELKNIMALLVRYPDYSRAFGKLYLMQLFDPRYGYGLAEAEWKRHDIKSVRKKILAAYNAGFDRIKHRPEWRWPLKARQYYKKIFYFMDLIKETEKEIKKIERFNRWPNGLIEKKSMNYALMKLALKAIQAKQKRKQKQIISRYLEKIKIAAGNKGGPLGENDLRGLFKT